MDDYSMMSQYKIKLRETLYCNSNCNLLATNILLEHFREAFSLINCSYDPIGVKIELKIKKSAMKKDKNFNNKAEYYYPLIAKTLHYYFFDPRIVNMINGEDLDSFIKIQCLPLESKICLVNSVTLLDNYLLIYL